MRAPWILVGLCAWLLGCGGPTVGDVCDALESDCGVPTSANCKADGEAVQKRADTARCSDQFDAYLRCSKDTTCGFRAACSDARKTLEACGVSLQ